MRLLCVQATIGKGEKVNIRTQTAFKAQKEFAILGGSGMFRLRWRMTNCGGVDGCSELSWMNSELECMRVCQVL